VACRRARAGCLPRAIVPSVVAASLNVTVPVGMPFPELSAIVDVNTTDCPTADGFGEETHVCPNSSDIIEPSMKRLLIISGVAVLSFVLGALKMYLVKRPTRVAYLIRGSPLRTTI
jgi:hypothetical protein